MAILIGSANSPTAVKALLGLRALRLLRVVPAVSRMFDLSASDIGRSLSGVLSSTALYLGALIYTAAVLVNMISCLWYFVARVEGAFDSPSDWPGGQRPMSWVTAATLGEQPLAECSKARIYLAGAYFAVTTLTTVGYGDITPKTSLEHGVAIGVMFVGILFFSFVVNSMGAALASSSAAARRSAALRAKFAEVEGWARARALPPPCAAASSSTTGRSGSARRSGARLTCTGSCRPRCAPRSRARWRSTSSGRPTCSPRRPSPCCTTWPRRWSP